MLTIVLTALAPHRLIINILVQLKCVYKTQFMENKIIIALERNFTEKEDLKNYIF